MSCYLERTRLYLDDYIYPRDLTLDLIDISIEDTQRKRPAHLSERLGAITYKDFFTAYNVCKKLHKKIRKMEGKDMEAHSKLSSNH
jgi:hypothetical protein